MHSPPRRIWLVLPVLLLLLLSPVTSAAAHFPAYEVIRPNIAFWIKVYTEYTTSQSIVHDSEDLTIIYDVIDLVPYDSPSAVRINRRRMKRARAKYEHILKRLAAHPETDDSVCRRVATLFGPGTTSRTFRAAGARVRCQVGQSDRFKAGLIRSGAYIEKIRAIFRTENLPEELAYLPHVESSFNAKAYSKFGAAGVWQFTRSTGKRFMKVGYVLDERRDPILATHAAASLLKENYEKLNSWPLAITAYNHGAAGMARARQSFGDYPAIFESYRSRTFKFASRNFYSEFLAACEVAQNYQTYFGDLELDRPAQFQVVTLDGYVNFEQLCDHYNLPLHLAQALNPALRPPVFNGQKLVPRGYPFRLPAALDPEGVPADLYSAVQKPSRFYTVQRGDTAGRIARSQGVRLTDLILANNLGRRARIYPKQTLRIPLPGETLPHLPAPSPTRPRESELLAKNDISTAAAVPPPAQPGTDPQPAPPTKDSAVAPEIDPAVENVANTGAEQSASVQETTGAADEPLTSVQETEDAADQPPTSMKETAEAANEPTTSVQETADAADEPPTGLEETAKAADEPPTSMEETAEASDEPPTSVQDTAEAADEPPTGLEETAEAADEPPTSVQETADAVDEPPPSVEIVAADVRFEKVIDGARRPIGILRAEVEETLGHYAEWAGVRTQQIRRLNGLAFGRTLHLHQKIKIPLTRITAREFEESRYEYHKRLQEDFFSAYRISDLQPYHVMRGDNLWSLCLEKFDIPMWLLKNCNPEVDFAALHLRQTLLVPTIEKSGGDGGEPFAEPESEHAQTPADSIQRASL